jgi:hypothetical protein
MSLKHRIAIASFHDLRIALSRMDVARCRVSPRRVGYAHHREALGPGTVTEPTLQQCLI